jgi:DNA-directed RNA polymerase II subunit RPB1
MKKILLAGTVAAALLAVSQQHASAWFNLCAGGYASISCGPPYCWSKNASCGAADSGYPAPTVFPAHGDGFAGYGDGFAGYGDGFASHGGSFPSYGGSLPGYGSTFPGYDNTTGAPADTSRPWTAPAPTPLPQGPATPKGGESSSPQPETRGSFEGYQPAGYSGGYQPASFWNDYQGGSGPVNYPPASYWESYQGGYQPFNSYDYSGYGSYLAPSWYGR